MGAQSDRQGKHGQSGWQSQRARWRKLLLLLMRCGDGVRCVLRDDLTDAPMVLMVVLHATGRCSRTQSLQGRRTRGAAGGAVETTRRMMVIHLRETKLLHLHFMLLLEQQLLLLINLHLLQHQLLSLSLELRL